MTVPHITWPSTRLAVVVGCSNNPIHAALSIRPNSGGLPYFSLYEASSDSGSVVGVWASAGLSRDPARAAAAPKPAARKKFRRDKPDDILSSPNGKVG